MDIDPGHHDPVHRSALSERDDRPIALLVNVLGSGGAQRRLATLANRFVELGRSVDVVSVYPDGPMRGMLSPSVAVETLATSGTSPIFSTAAHAGGLVRYLNESKPSVLMSCVTDVHLLAVLAGALQGRRVPLVLRASRHPYRSLPRARIVKRLTEPLTLRKVAWCYARADAIVALSSDAAGGLRRLLGDRPMRIETILNPVVESTLLDHAEEPSARIRNVVPLVLGVGRLVEQKDFATLLRAFALVRAQRPARLVLLGKGGQARRLETLARKLGIDADVDMPGEVNDVTEWLRRADLLVSSSLWEGLQATPIEALAVGCPVVATDCPGGARETLDQGRLGPLVPVRDPVAMARAMIDQLDHPPDPRLLASGAARFTSTGKAERYLALFDSLATERGDDAR